jgi:hypothetical protein
MDIPEVQIPEDFYKFVVLVTGVAFLIASYTLTVWYGAVKSIQTDNLFLTLGVIVMTLMLIGVALAAGFYLVWALKKWYENQKVLDKLLRIRCEKELSEAARDVELNPRDRMKAMSTASIEDSLKHESELKKEKLKREIEH